MSVSRGPAYLWTIRYWPWFVRVQLPGGVSIAAAAAGLDSSYAVDNAGRLWAWGSNEIGQRSGVAGGPQPVRLGSLAGVRSVAAGAGHALALLNNGYMWA